MDNSKLTKDEVLKDALLSALNIFKHSLSMRDDFWRKNAVAEISRLKDRLQRLETEVAEYDEFIKTKEHRMEIITREIAKYENT